MQLCQEQLYLISDSFVWIFKQHTNVDYFTLQLEHVVDDQMSNYHQTLLPNLNIPIVKKIKHVFGALVHLIWESVEKVSQSYRNVSLYAEFDI